MINANTKTAALVFLLAGIIFAAIETGNRRKNVSEISPVLFSYRVVSNQSNHEAWVAMELK